MLARTETCRSKFMVIMASLRQHIWITQVVMTLKREGNYADGCLKLRVHSFGLFWLFLSRFRKNGIQGISISKRTLLLKTEYPWRRCPENYYVCTRAEFYVGFPAKNFPKKRVFCLLRVNRIICYREQNE